MGLDIGAYRRLVKAQPGEGMDPNDAAEPDYDNGGWFRLRHNPDFPGRADDIQNGAIYRVEDEDAFSFRAGSYSGYNRWRDQLAELTGAYVAVAAEGYNSSNPSYAAGAWDGRATEGPFFELINFSDCEGVIGATVSAKLAADFAAFQEKADAHPDEYFRERYTCWRKAFEMAADGGCVDFG